MNDYIARLKSAAKDRMNALQEAKLRATLALGVAWSAGECHETMAQICDESGNPLFTIRTTGIPGTDPVTLAVGIVAEHNGALLA